jgi:hypothetical protein
MTVRSPLLDENPDPINALIRREMERRGYQIVRSDDGLEERVIRPDGTVAVIARRKPEESV